MGKKVSYLFGAGATQAVIRDIDPDKSLMTKDIQELIETYSKHGIELKIWNELTTVYDVEHLISVLESQSNFSTSEKLRRYYRKALVELAKKAIKSDSATLYTILSDLHLNVISELPDDQANFQEELLCFITLNYEDILERSVKKQLGCKIDYVVETANPSKNGKKINVIKLHGSFNWTNSRPIQIKSMASLVKAGSALWIPPGVEKRKDNYPFNLLWGRAKEFLMQSDVLRVVGCSLSRNDWGLIPILYTVKRFNDQKSIEIEIIDYLDTGENIEKNYSYLDVKKITEIEAMKSYYKRKFPKSSDEKSIIEEMKNLFRSKDKTNAFQKWLDAKIDDLIENKIDISKGSFVHNFYYKA